MGEGGFDVVIGNPPYFNIQTLGAKSTEVQYIMDKYSYIWQDKSDILFYFIAKATEITKGYISYIISNAFLFADKAKKLRNYLLEKFHIDTVVNFERHLVFKDAAITTSIVRLNKKHSQKPTKVINLKDKQYTQEYISNYIHKKTNYFDVIFKKDSVFALIDKKTADMNDKIDGDNKALRDLVKIGKGMETAANDVFVFSEYPSQFPADFVKRRMAGENIKRYYIEPNKQYLLYFEDVENFNALPNEIKEHLNLHRRRLKNRADKKRRATAEWWNYTFAMHKEYYHLNKIWCSYRGPSNAFAYDDTGECVGLTNTTVIFDTNAALSLKYILALLNSKVLSFRYKSIGKQTGSGIYEYFENGVGKLPIPIIDMDKQQKYINLVDDMINTHTKYHQANTPRDKALHQKRIDVLDAHIDRLVYGLYGLNEEEIGMVGKGV